MKKGYADGGMTMVNKGGKMVPDFAADGKGKMSKGGMASGMHKMPNGKMMKDSDMKGGTKKMMSGGMSYAKGGVATSLKSHASMPASKAHKGLKAGGSVGTTKMGSVKTATKPDGGISKGGTKGTMVKMSRGGKTC